MTTTQRPAADELTGRIAQHFANAFTEGLGVRFALRDLAWSDEMEDDLDATWVVVDKQGRRFEISFEVFVTELTDKVLADRAALMERIQKTSARASGSETGGNR